MYVCICNAITDKDIRRAAANGADTLYELQDRLGVATCCGSCASHANEILNDSRMHNAHSDPTLYVPSPA